MTTITIPKELSRKDELVLIPKAEYEKLIAAKRVVEFTPTPAERRDLARGRKNYARGKFLTFDELKRNLGFTR